MTGNQKGASMKERKRSLGVSVAVILAFVCMLLAQGCLEQARSDKASIEFDNAFFYKADGSFNVERGKDAYIALMKYHGYPIFEGLREGLWVSDYGLGEFTKLGLGATGFLNDQKSGYLGQDMFLLPNQMLPEHYHLKTAKGPAKMEGWHVRHGISYVYGEGRPTRNMKAVIPKCHMNGTVSVRHETILGPGQTAKLNRKTARHWQFGGPEGAIVSEYGTFHDNDGVRHSGPKLVFP
jgi:D-lyxose ketol-isomerase